MRPAPSSVAALTAGGGGGPSAGWGSAADSGPSGGGPSACWGSAAGGGSGSWGCATAAAAAARAPGDSVGAVSCGGAMLMPMWMCGLDSRVVRSPPGLGVIELGLVFCFCCCLGLRPLLLYWARPLRLSDEVLVR